MKLMTQTRAAMLSLICSGIAFAGGEGWTTDYEAAKKEAASAGKSMLIDFTGSDWCGWCIKLSDEVFKHDSFKEGVKDKFVLLELDYPQDKSGQSEALQKQNQELAEKYAVQGFPTILLADGEGRPYASTGYQPDGPVKYVKHLDELAAKRKARDEGFAAADKLSGAEQAKAYVAALDAMELEDSTLSGFYGETIEKIKKADPEDATGFSKRLESKEKLAKFEASLNELGQKQDFDGALKLVEETLKYDGFSPEDKQRVALMKALVLAEQGKFDEAVAAADEAKKIAPESETAGQIDGLKTQLQAMKGQQ